MQPYTYYLYHKPTGKHYYGVRTAKDCHPDELWKTYFSTSKIVKSLREQHGDDSFEYEVRKLFETSEDALSWETKFLTRIDAASKDEWLNRHNGGKNFCTTGIPSWIVGKTHSERTRKKISEKRKSYVGEKHPMYGKTHSEESKQKMAINREKKLGKDNHFYGKQHSAELKKYISELNKGRPSPRKNVVLSDEQRKKQSDSMKNKLNIVCPHCNKEGKPSGMKRYHFDNCRLKPTP
jgi:group I intron endonuclease